LFQSLVVFFLLGGRTTQLKNMLVKLDHLPHVWDEEFQKIFETHLEPAFSAFDICRIREFVPTFRHRSGHRAIYKITRLNPTTSLAFRLWLPKITAIQPDNLKNTVDNQ